MLIHASALQPREMVQPPEQTNGVQLLPLGKHPLVTQSLNFEPAFNTQLPPHTVALF